MAGQLGEEHGQVAGGGRRERAVPGDLARRVGDVNDLGWRRAVSAAVLAVAEPEVERGPDHDDQVGFAESQQTVLS